MKQLHQIVFGTVGSQNGDVGDVTAVIIGAYK
jgi:hypothetical protein